MKRNLLVFCSIIFCLLAGCEDKPVVKEADGDTPKKGTIYISVDESFKPVIEEQIKVYESSHPEAHIIPSYKPEVECFRDLQKDSTRMVIVARGLKKEERKFYFDLLKFNPSYSAVAYDAVAIIVNRNTKDSVFTMARLKSILRGKEKITAVMDGKNATSTVRYLQDSIMKGTAFGANVVAAANSQDVITTVSAQENAIGFVGLSWVGDKYDTKQQALLQNIKLALVECTICTEGEFAKPSQATITYLQYPLARPVFYIVKENFTKLGTAFANFMSLERGQLIFRRSFLAPAKINFNKRTSNIKNDD